MAAVPLTVATLDTLAGRLCIYDAKSLAVLVTSLPKLQTQPHFMKSAEPHLLTDGFSMEQWVSYARRKASIASRVCKENGKLKAIICKLGQDLEDFEETGTLKKGHIDNQFADPLMHNDPWKGCSFPARTPDHVPGSPSSWSTWRRAQNKQGAGGLEDGLPEANSEESATSIIAPSGAGDGDKHTANDERTVEQSDEEEFIATTPSGEQVEAQHVASHQLVGNTANPIDATVTEGSYDLPAKSWDVKSLKKILSGNGDDRLDVVLHWLKLRYFSKLGQPMSIVRADVLIGDLTDIEMQSALRFCKTFDESLLQIPLYRKRQHSVEDDASAGEGEIESVEGHGSNETKVEHSNNSKVDSVHRAKLKGINCRGMAQPRRKK